MCGISGVVGRMAQDDALRVAAMNKAMRHRGPDDEGLWQFGSVGDPFGAVLGHRRLSIIDLRSAAAQPMIDPATGTALVFNGEIYNFLSLRAELQNLGERFQTNGDSEVILRGYLRWGGQIVARLRGMFAFVIVDPSRQSAFFARDGVGIKPLYTAVARDERGVRATAFASEGRALVAGGFARPVTDSRRVYHYLWGGFSTAPSTIWRDIQEFPRGTTAELDATMVIPTAVRYWTVGRGSSDCDRPAKEMLEESVAMHLVSDVPKVVFLSGGIDSSAVVALARLHDPELTTLSLGFAERGSDETRFAEAVAAAAGTRHVSIRHTPHDMLAAIDRAIGALDQPSFDGINTWLVSGAAAELGFKVGLSGAGGDELTGGYKSFRRLPVLAKLLNGPASSLAAVAAKLLGEVAPTLSERRKIQDLVRGGGDLLRLYQTQYSLRSRSEMVRILLDHPDKDDLYGLDAGRAADLCEQIEDMSPLRALSVLETELFLGDRLLRDSDVMSMNHSIELRVPLVDTVLSDGFDGLSDDRRYGVLGTKPPIRHAATAIVGREAIRRPKQGFELPMDAWLRHDLKETVEMTLLDREACLRIGLNDVSVASLWHLFLATRSVYWTRIWAMFVLIRWAGINDVTIE